MGYIGKKPTDVPLTSSDITDNTITSSKIVDGTIVDADINASAAIAESKLGVTSYDDNKLQSNIALLGFKTAVNGSLAKYNLQDQIIDEYTDATGIDASASTNENLTSGYFYGGAGSSVTATQDADETGTDGLYTWYKWTDTSATGSYSQDTAQSDIDWLVVGGGGGGGYANPGGGGGAGGLRTSYGSASGGGGSVESKLSLGASTSYTITIGAGGAGAGAGNTGATGGDSIISGSDITDITSNGGGGGGGYNANVTTNGGSGGGRGDPNGSTGAGTGTANQGYGGGEHGGVAGNDSTQAGGGGGGASAVGGNGTHSANGGAGGAGLNISITGSSVGYAGGGGGGNDQSGGTATHGGGAGRTGSSGGAAGTANTGGGGGGGTGSPKAGGSGVVILRRLTLPITAGADLTLQSIDTTAMAQPSTGDMVMLMENKHGTNTLNTDIKGWISRDSGTTFTQGTLVDEGTWGTNKKILSFHDLDISGQPSGTDMCYKITTHNQSAGSKEAYIHATSIGWK